VNYRKGRGRSLWGGSFRREPKEPDSIGRLGRSLRERKKTKEEQKRALSMRTVGSGVTG